MVSRRNYFTITLIMLAVLFLFQTPEVVKERMNDYGSNGYALDAGSEWKQTSQLRMTKADGRESGRAVVFIGNTGGHALGITVRQWCTYSKRYLESYEKLKQYTFRKDQMPEAVILDASCLNVEKDTAALEELVKQGVNLIFCGLPDLEQLKKSQRLKRLMGIRAIPADRVQAKGIHLFDSLLLGGEKIYQLDDTMESSQQDLELLMTWCQTASGTKTYMVGMTDDTVKNEDLPALIWRNSVGQARVFVVNGDYLNDSCGIGFLEGMFYEMQDYALYPVINAQNLVVLNYPVLTSENEETMMRLYSRTLEAVYRDLVWPGISLTSEKSGKKLTCMLAPQQNYADDLEPDPDLLVSYMKQLQEKKGEAGISGTIREGTFLEKLRQDKTFLDKELPDYAFLSFYKGKLTGEETAAALDSGLLDRVRTVFSDYDGSEPIVSYLYADITKQCMTSDGVTHTFSDDLRMNSVQTALGYSSIAIDLNQTAYPQSDDDSWEKLYDRFSRNVNTYWQAYEALDTTTLAESDMRIRRFLALKYKQERTEDVITLSLDHLEEEAFFVLRLQGEAVRGMQGGEYEMLQKDAYLIRADKEQVVITLDDPSKDRFYH